MHIGQVIGVFLIIPATILLTISFFVLLVLRKLESEGLKAFGHVIVVLLWVSAVMLLGLGTYKIITGNALYIPHVMVMPAERRGMSSGMMMEKMMMDKMGCMPMSGMKNDNAGESKPDLSGKNPMHQKMQ